MSRTSKDNSVHLSIIHIISEHLEPLFDVNGPNPKVYEAVLFVSVRFYIIVIKSLYGFKLLI